MSLTSLLEGPAGSPVHQFFRTQLGQGRALSTHLNRLVGVTPHRPSPGIPLGAVGTAIDYRIRFGLAEQPIGALIGVQMAHAAGLPNGAADALVASLQTSLSTLRPWERDLDATEEDHLLRHCYVLALIDPVLRAGYTVWPPWPDRPQWPHHLLGICEEPTLADLRGLVEAAAPMLDDLRHRAVGGHLLLNPVLPNSGIVGGADADLVVDTTLVDVKVTIGNGIDGRTLRQVAGYTLLDTADAFGIRDVAFVLVRHGWCVRLGDTVLLAALSGDLDGRAASQLACVGPHALDAELRAEPGDLCDLSDWRAVFRVALDRERMWRIARRDDRAQ